MNRCACGEVSIKSIIRRDIVRYFDKKLGYDVLQERLVQIPRCRHHLASSSARINKEIADERAKLVTDRARMTSAIANLSFTK